MNVPRHSRLVLTLALIVGGALVGCSSTRKVVTEADDASAVGPALEARLSDASAPPVLALSGDSLLVAGGLDATKDGAVVATSAAVVDVATGSVRNVDAPKSDGPVVVLSATTGPNGSFVALGARCPEGESLPAVDPLSGCSPASGSSFILDASGTTWREVRLPEAIAPLPPTSPAGFSGSVSTAGDGTVFATVRTEGSGNGPLDSVLRLDGNEWRALATSTFLSESCPTRNALNLLTKEPSGDGESRVRLVEVGGDGKSTEVALPDLDISSGAAMVHVGCDSDTVYLSSPPKSLDGSTTLFRRKAGASEWAQTSLPAGAIPNPESLVSNSQKVLMRALSQVGKGAGGGASPVLVEVSDGGASVRTVDGNPAVSWLVSDFPKGKVVAVGPIPALETPAGGPSTSPSGPVTVRFFE